MSLILDALRKSEAERRRGQMPDLRAELPPTVRSVAPPRRWPLWFAGVAATIAILALAWGAWNRTPTVPPAEAPADASRVELADDAPAATTMERSSEPAVVAAPPAIRSTPIPGAEPERTRPVDDDVRAAASARAAPPMAEPPPVATRMPAPEPAAAPAGTDTRYDDAIVNAASTDAPARPTSPASAPAPVAPLPMPLPATGVAVRIADLSPGEREQLPPLKISMHMFGPTPAQRFAIIDGTRVTQGDRVGEAVVEEIASDSVLLNWHGRRVSLPLR